MVWMEKNRNHLETLKWRDEIYWQTFIFKNMIIWGNRNTSLIKIHFLPGRFYH